MKTPRPALTGEGSGARPHQWLQLPLVHQAELADEIEEVFVAGVDVSFGPHAQDAVEVMDVDVDKDPEEAGQDLGADLLEVLGEGNA